MAIRLMGKAGFAHLQQDGQRLQIYVKKDAIGEAGYEPWELLDLGDHVAGRGYRFDTRTGEHSILARQFSFLSNALRPLPASVQGPPELCVSYRHGSMGCGSKA